MPTKQVTVSGSVGKQVYNDAAHAAALSGVIQKVILNSVIVDAPVSAASITIRDGGPSGDVFLTATVPAGSSDQFEFGHPGERFDKGMHVKVTGTNNKAYLVIL